MWQLDNPLVIPNLWCCFDALPQYLHDPLWPIDQHSQTTKSYLLSVLTTLETVLQAQQGADGSVMADLDSIISQQLKTASDYVHKKGQGPLKSYLQKENLHQFFPKLCEKIGFPSVPGQSAIPPINGK